MALLACAAIGAEAAGLGKLTVNSSLGQPLNAEIDLVSLQPGELEDLQARVASPESFRDARIEYGPSMRHLRFAVEKRPNGQAYLKVTSQVPINEPFLDVLVEITWPAGRIQREYPILLDPPGYAHGKVTPPSGASPSPPAQAAAAQPSPPASAPAASSSAPAASTPSTGPAASGGPSARAELVREPGATQASGDTYGPVQKGETLRKIAEETKPADVSLEQMLVALYRENQAAFAGNNMNRLKAGQILKVPSGEQVAQITRSEANREYRAQVNDWRAYREQLAGGVGAIPARPEATAAASGRVTTAAVTPPPAATAEPKDTLKLSRTDTRAGAGAGKAGS
ncbi:MAG TPA: FimV/HubP family polar landmark protein, partial [Acetobacteraceae bacterium]|nr:FimV/HubP family polar landmark protein [Acetobacteraceae bacterium]